MTILVYGKDYILIQFSLKEFDENQDNNDYRFQKYGMIIIIFF
jgi:hypothetical protein